MESQRVRQTRPPEPAPRAGPLASLTRPLAARETMPAPLRPARTLEDFTKPALLAPARLQAKLTINQPGDIYEQEADDVAAEVVASSAPPGLSPKCACGGTPGPDGECAACRAKRLGLQRRAATDSALAEVPSIVHEALQSRGQPLEPATRAFMEARFGHDFSRIRVHTDAPAAAAAQAANARAYTVGRDVVFAAGEYRPDTAAGQRLLAHELTHVLQQRADAGHGRAMLQRQSENPTEEPKEEEEPGKEEEPREESGEEGEPEKEEEPSKTCKNPLFLTHIELPLVADVYLRDGREISANDHAKIKAQSAKRCKLTHHLTHAGADITVDFFYTGRPCCDCSTGFVIVNGTVDGEEVYINKGLRSRRTCKGDPCCDVKKSFSIRGVERAGRKFSGRMNLGVWALKAKRKKGSKPRK